jgi:dUTP pyrophosphatase
MTTLHIKLNESNLESYYANHKPAYAGDCGIDLFFTKDYACNPGVTTTIDLGVSCMMTDASGKKISYYVVPRSSISKTPLIMHNSIGIIDSNYTGPIKVAVRNISNNAYFIRKGDRLFQVCDPGLTNITVKVVEQLNVTERGDKGFGSSGA